MIIGESCGESVFSRGESLFSYAPGRREMVDPESYEFLNFNGRVSCISMVVASEFLV